MTYLEPTWTLFTFTIPTINLSPSLTEFKFRSHKTKTERGNVVFSLAQLWFRNRTHLHSSINTFFCFFWNNMCLIPICRPTFLLLNQNRTLLYPQLILIVIIVIGAFFLLSICLTILFLYTIISIYYLLYMR